MFDDNEVQIIVANDYGAEFTFIEYLNHHQFGEWENDEIKANEYAKEYVKEFRDSPYCPLIMKVTPITYLCVKDMATVVNELDELIDTHSIAVEGIYDDELTVDDFKGMPN